ncbi:MAG: fructose-bisphosphate aldolase class I, partial [Azospira oryzae]
RILLEGVILKPNMILPGLRCPDPVSVDEVAQATVNCLRQVVPTAVAGIAFLSGGQSAQLATKHINAMHLRCSSLLPWPLTFSFARAIQQPAMKIWQGKSDNILQAQEALYHRAMCNSEARLGKYNFILERDPVL